MAFEPLTKKPPVRVKTLGIFLEVDTAEDGTKDYHARYKFVLVDEDGVKVDDPLESGELIQHLSSQEIQQAKSFLDAQLVKAEGRLG